MNRSPKSREPLSSLVLYRCAKWSFITPLFTTYFRGRVHGLNKVPQSGPVVVVSNHGSYFDPPILSTCLCRPVSFMAKEELFKVPGLKQIIELYGAYPVKRGAGDRGAIKAALKSLRNGWMIGIFLEGTRTADARINHPKLGAAMIAAKTQAPLLPVSLWGTEKILRKGSSLPRRVPLTIRIGDLISPPPSTRRQALEEKTEECTKVVNALHAIGR